MIEMRDAIGHMRIRFWTCPEHRRGRVIWRFGVAYCAERCARTSLGYCECDRPVMMALSPMHPDTYLWLACPFHRSIEMEGRVERSVHWAKIAARNYARRQAHDLAEELGLAPRTCHRTVYLDGFVPDRCGRVLDDDGHCPGTGH